MTTISYCAYTPDKRPLAPLDHDKVGLLNKGATHDITSRVKDVVQRHLDYKGTEKFTVEFTRQKITFSLKSGSDVHNRTLTYDNGQWMLSKNSAAPTALTPELQKEVDRIIDDVLYRIRNSHNSGAPVSRSPSFTPSSTSFDASGHRYASAPQFHPFETRSWGPRTASFESHSSRSFGISERAPSRRVEEELEPDLEESDDEEALRTQRRGFDEHREKHSAALDKLQTEVTALRRELEAANAAKDGAARESKRKIAELEASVKEKESQCEALKSQNASEVETTDAATELLKRSQASLKKLGKEKAELDSQLKESQGHLEKLRTQATEAQEGIKAELARVKASLEELQEAAQKQKAQLEHQLAAAKAELASLKKTNAESLARAEEVKKAETALREQVAAEREKAQKMEAGFKETLESKQRAIQNLEQATQQLRSEFNSKSGENYALKYETDRLGKAEKEQIEEIRRLKELLNNLQAEMKQQALKIAKIKENYHLITSKFPSLAVEYGAFLNFLIEDEDGFEALDKSIQSKSKTHDRKEEQ